MSVIRTFIIAASCLLTGLAGAAERTAAKAVPQAGNPWFQQGQQRIRAMRALKHRDHSARNIILFIGDGMSIPTITAARIREGQLRGETGEENSLSFEHFPYTALAKTYNVNSQTPDSAGTATAMLTGVKTNIGELSVYPDAQRGQCLADQPVPETFLELAEDRAWVTGVVTTTRITHATPASTYTHSVERNWEADRDIPEAARQAGCKDIAWQLVNFSHGDGIEVLFGGGRREFLPDTQSDPEYPKRKGLRLDARNLIEAWRQRYPGGQWLWNDKQFSALKARRKHVLGLFEPSHMKFEADRKQDAAGEPSLSAMTRAAIQQLQAYDKHFFLLVEGGRIDHAHHFGMASYALSETIEFAHAVQVADELTRVDDTLIIVTADHSHTLSMAGYPKRGNDILGKVIEAGEDHFALALDGKPYTTLSYANGPGGIIGQRADLSQVDTSEKSFHQQAPVRLGNETHGGDDVAIFARGPMAFLFGGVVEQNYIFHVMYAASGIR